MVGMSKQRPLQRTELAAQAASPFFSTEAIQANAGLNTGFGDFHYASSPLPPRAAATVPTFASTPVMQRVVNLNANTRASANAQYFIKNNQKTVLYGLTTAPAPRPRSLYRQDGETSTDDQNLYKWVPNIRLFSNAERTRIESVDHNTSDLMRDLDQGIKNPEANENTLALPSRGLLGKNDCDGLGLTLRTMMGQEGVDNTALGGDRAHMAVGDQMRHNFPDGADCQYHSATVVAADLPSLVTLEADVSKDRARPEFAIRNGVDGFVADNNADGADYGDNVTISRAQGQEASDETMEQLRGIHRDFAEYRDAYYLWPSQGVTETAFNTALSQAQMLALTKIRTIANRYWGHYTNWKFVPKGVDAIRSLLAPMPQADGVAARLAQVRDAAGTALQRVDGGRKRLTTDFYTALSAIQVDDAGQLDQLRGVLDGLIARMRAKQD